MHRPSEVSKRDYFAGMALQGLVARSEPNDDDLSFLAIQAYSLADDMADAVVGSFIDNIKNGDLHRVKTILEEDSSFASLTFDFGDNPHFSTYNDMTALTISINNRYSRRSDMIRLLLSYGANPNAKTKEGSAKALAEEIRDREVLKLFEEYKPKKDK